MGKIHSPLTPTQHLPRPVGQPAGGGAKSSVKMNPSSIGKKGC